MAWILAGAGVGALTGILLWRWLRTGTYRKDGDIPRRSATQLWWVVPGAAVAGAVAGGLQGWLTAAAAVYLLGGVAISWVDLDVHRVPDRILSIVLPAVVAALAAAAAGTGDWGLLARAMLAALALGALFLVLAIVGSMGLGDVKLAVVTGLTIGALGWGPTMLAVLATFAVAGIAAVAMLLSGAHRTQHLPFAPAIVAGAGIAITAASLQVL